MMQRNCVRDLIYRGLPVGAATLLFATQAQAHHAMDGQTPSTLFEGLLSGLAHPVIGLDHFAFLVVAALLASTLRSGARYLVPLAFVGATLGGSAMHLVQTELPLVETFVALSVLLGGVMVVLRKDVSALLLGVSFALVGVFHGYAYAESIIGAEQTPLLAYLAGFSMIQYALIVGGVWLIDRLAMRSGKLQLLAQRLGGGFAALVGGAFLALSIA